MRGLSQVAKSNGFDKAYREFSPLLQRRVSKTVEKLAENPDLPGLNIEPVRSANLNVRSCRVTKQVRMIFRIEEGGAIELPHVDKHEEAYRKAETYWLGVLSRPGRFHEEKFSMFQPLLEFDPAIREGILRQLHEAGVQGGLAADLAGATEGLISETLADGTEGRAKLPADRGPAGFLNVIPSDVTGPCTDLLIAFCFDGDDFGNRLRETAYHAGIHCPDTRLIVFVTSKWDPRTWKRDHERAFADLDARLVVLFAGLGRLSRLM